MLFYYVIIILLIMLVFLIPGVNTILGFAILLLFIWIIVKTFQNAGIKKGLQGILKCLFWCLLALILFASPAIIMGFLYNVSK